MMGSQRPSEAINELGQTRVRLNVPARCVAEAMHVGPGRVSYLESVPVETLKLATVERYLEALSKCSGTRIAITWPWP